MAPFLLLFCVLSESTAQRLASLLCRNRLSDLQLSCFAQCYRLRFRHRLYHLYSLSPSLLATTNVSHHRQLLSLPSPSIALSRQHLKSLISSSRYTGILASPVSLSCAFLLDRDRGLSPPFKTSRNSLAWSRRPRSSSRAQHSWAGPGLAGCSSRAVQTNSVLDRCFRCVGAFPSLVKLQWPSRRCQVSTSGIRDAWKALICVLSLDSILEGGWSQSSCCVRTCVVSALDMGN